VSAAAAYVDQASPRSLPKAPAVVLGALAGLGLIAFVVGLGNDPATAWRAFHVNYLYFGALSQGGLIIACAFVIVGAQWPGPIRRIAEALAAFVPVTFVMGLIGWFGGASYIYPWRADYHGVVEALPWKEAWLNPARLAIVDLTLLAVLTVLTFLFLRASLRPALRGATATGFAGRMIESWTADWKGDAEEAAESARKLKNLAPLIALVYAFGWSIIAFDQIMSLEPTWFSNLFGAYFAWGGFLSAISATTLLAILHRNYAGLEGQITTDRMHDLGKMIFAFSIFWMYLFFSQYIVIWYGNLPEETQFFRDRLGTEFLQSTWYWEGWLERILGEPWVRVTLFAWVCIWVIPFWCLLGQRPKKTPWFLATIASISLFGFWVERNVLIWPSLVPEDTWAFLGSVQVGVALGFLGLFGLVWLTFARVFPSLAIPRAD
jgi:hypothetical protein